MSRDYSVSEERYRELTLCPTCYIKLDVAENGKSCVRCRVGWYVPQVMSEDWLLENLPEDWHYDCRMEPENAFVIYPPCPEVEPFVIPLRLLK